MAKKEFTYKGKTDAELRDMSLAKLSEVMPARLRRKIKRGFTEQEKILLRKIEKKEPNLETHCRDMMILPVMFGRSIRVYNGKEFVAVNITAEMIGHVMGEFVLTRSAVKHNAPGIGATKSSGALSVR